MREPIRILLLDDGELTHVAQLLDARELEYTRIQHCRFDPQEIAPPSDLLIATGRYAQRVRRGSPPGARSGRPLRIIATPEDSSAVRRSLRRSGFHLRVRLPGHPDIWDLLIRRALYPGDERRHDDRIAVGAAISLDLASNPRARTNALLMDISNRGCRIHTQHRLGLGRILGIVLPEDVTNREPLEIPGRVVRAAKDTQNRGHYAGILFDPEMSNSVRIRLSSLINQWSLGPHCPLDNPNSSDLPLLPASPCASIEGLTLDDETDPPVPVPHEIAHEPVDTHLGTTEERRGGPRGSFSAPVPAHQNGRGKVLMARDLSDRGMKIEPMQGVELGQEIQLVLHAPELMEAIQLSAQVVREDEGDGMVLEFRELSSDQRRRLDKLVTCLPQVEPLTLDDGPSMGAILAELVDESPRLR